MPRTSICAMAFEPVIAIYDACILYPFHLRNIIVQVGVDRLVHARWTEEIHDEWMRSLVANAPSLLIERLEATKQLMNIALPAATVTGYDSIFRPSACPILTIGMSSQQRSRPKPHIS